MKYTGFRVIGSKPGCVDFLGEIEAEIFAEAEKYFLETFDWDEEDWLDFYEVDSEENEESGAKHES